MPDRVVACCGTLQCLVSTRHCITLQHAATCCTTLHQFAAHSRLVDVRCNTLRHTATHCNTLQHTATHCNTLQHTATHCNTLQHTATHCNTPTHVGRDSFTPRVNSVWCETLVTRSHHHVTSKAQDASSGTRHSRLLDIPAMPHIDGT